jgi:hypothetical protein
VRGDFRLVQDRNLNALRKFCFLGGSLCRRLLLVVLPFVILGREDRSAFDNHSGGIRA